MQRLLNEICETQLKVDSLTLSTPAKASEHSAPATDTEIITLRANLAEQNLGLPPSFEQFLRITNGIKRYRYPERFNLRSISKLVGRKQSDKGWDFPAPLCDFVIGRGNATAQCSFDPGSIDSMGEMAVVEFNVEGTRTDHVNFEAFLRYDLAHHQFSLETEESDRANLADD